MCLFASRFLPEEGIVGVFVHDGLVLWNHFVLFGFIICLRFDRDATV